MLKQTERTTGIQAENMNKQEKNNLRKIKGKTRKIGHSIGLTSGLFSMSSKQIVSNDHHACRFFLSSSNSWLGLDFFPSKGGKCMEYYSFDLRSLLSPRTSIGFHKRLEITRGRNKSRDQRPRLGTKFRDQSLQASKWYLKCKCRPKKWIKCSL